MVKQLLTTMFFGINLSGYILCNEINLTITPYSLAPSLISFSDNDALMASAPAEQAKKVIICCMNTMQEVAIIETDDLVDSVALSGDGTRLAILENGGMLSLFSLNKNLYATKLFNIKLKNTRMESDIAFDANQLCIIVTNPIANRNKYEKVFISAYSGLFCGKTEISECAPYEKYSLKTMKCINTGNAKKLVFHSPADHFEVVANDNDTVTITRFSASQSSSDVAALSSNTMA